MNTFHAPPPVNTFPRSRWQKKQDDAEFDKIIDELKLSEADANGDGLVDFEEFVTAFKAYAMRQQTEVNTAGRKLTFEQYFQGLTIDLNKRVIDIVGQMATALAQ